MAQGANSAWLSLPRASAVGWGLLTKKHYKSPFHNFNDGIILEDIDNVGRHMTEKRLVFNISGRKFEISQYLIDRYPYTLLGSKDRELFYDSICHEYFFDRDPELFRYILFYYRNGHTHFPKKECSAAFQEELLFFRLDAEDLAICCYEEFQDCHQDTLERFEEQNPNLCLYSNEKFKGLRCKGPRYKIWEAFENPESSLIAQVIYYVSGFFIAASVTANVVETIETFSPDSKITFTLGTQYESIFFCADAACVLLFTLEYLFRLISSPDPCKFVRSVMSLIDIIAILPFYIGLVMPDNKVSIK